MKQGRVLSVLIWMGKAVQAKFGVSASNTLHQYYALLLTQVIYLTLIKLKAYNGQIQGLDTTIFTGLDSSKIF